MRGGKDEEKGRKEAQMETTAGKEREERVRAIGKQVEMFKYGDKEKIWMERVRTKNERDWRDRQR